MNIEISPFKNWISLTLGKYRTSITKGRHTPKGKLFQYSNYGYCDIRKIRIETFCFGIIICWKK